MIDDFREVIASRRDGRIQTPEELQLLAKGATDGSVPDYQLSAWLMATYLNPLTTEEVTQLTLAMADSGERLDLSSIPGPHLDKHSTGGVGDKTTIVLLPILAACGLNLVKMSGAGLGITGGTTDKLLSIPGMRLDLTPDQMILQAREVGLALTAQTADLAPADKVLYSLRDATATTESVGLIVSSILSKKIAGGADIVLLDVKCGSGGFMKTRPEAERLKEMLENVGSRCGLKVIAEITDMSQPLGAAIGNALEIEEAIRVLSNQPLSPESKRFAQLCTEFAIHALEAADIEEPEAKVMEALKSGAAQRKAEQWIAHQGGPDGFNEILKSLPNASIQIPVKADRTGTVVSLDAGKVGEIVVELGGGRKKKGDKIDPAVGIVLHTSISRAIRQGDTMATIHANAHELGTQMAQRLKEAILIA